MNQIPLPILLAVIVLICWPAFELVAAWGRKPTQIQLRTLLDELRADSRFSDSERDVIASVRNEARGNAINLFMPLLAPAVIYSSIVNIEQAKHFGHIIPSLERESLEERHELRRTTQVLYGKLLGVPEQSLLWKDERFWRAVDLSATLGMLSWPLTFGITMIFGGAALIAALVIFGARISFSGLRLRLSHVAHLLRFLGHALRES